MPDEEVPTCSEDEDEDVVDVEVTVGAPPAKTVKVVGKVGKVAGAGIEPT